MSEDKFPSMFNGGGYCVYYPSNIFRNTRDLNYGKYHSIFPSFRHSLGHIRSRDAFRPIMYEWKYLFSK